MYELLGKITSSVMRYHLQPSLPFSTERINHQDYNCALQTYDDTVLNTHDQVQIQSGYLYDSLSNQAHHNIVPNNIEKNITNDLESVSDVATQETPIQSNIFHVLCDTTNTICTNDIDDPLPQIPDTPKLNPAPIPPCDDVPHLSLDANNDLPIPNITETIPTPIQIPTVIQPSMNDEANIQQISIDQNSELQMHDTTVIQPSMNDESNIQQISIDQNSELQMHDTTVNQTIQTSSPSHKNIIKIKRSVPLRQSAIHANRLIRRLFGKRMNKMKITNIEQK